MANTFSRLPPHLSLILKISYFTQVITDREIYKRVVLDAVPKAQSFLWIATADIKDMYVKQGPRMIPFLQILSNLIETGVSIRLVHAKEPGPAFRKDFDRFPNLIDGMEMILCPRTHFKTVIVDGKIAYTGSANLTGAGMGAKSENRRNFESGIFSDEPEIIRPLMEQFDQLWIGSHCQPCQRKAYCVTYHELIG
jgi:phosphatidylserine/phosphatidylglycerophosphate/cardiolipin synthase-like enzyme